MSQLQVTDKLESYDAPAGDSRPSPSDADLLYEYATSNSETAFVEIVRRHGDFVYSSALRQLNDHAMAQDVAQAVFIILARKASSLRRETVLAGWLFKAVRFAVKDALKIEVRRRCREEKSAAMDLLNETKEL